ncbi:universal stress protein [Nonomuraea sp. NBC_01738]|uniref:universal stress protein n=1 Tax=Nonomuraea sp. NBC_01738 TaxID=2976003 RepID=UPI002E1447F4|nr:universal stress protein [Nonomuraea sp. NBC_01738]
MILVGVDGSRAGLEAAIWAAREAALRKDALRVVHALPSWIVEQGDGPYAGVGNWMREGGQAVLTSALQRIEQEEPAVGVTSALLPGDPREALMGAAADADLLVVGNHGMGGFRGLLLGSVAYGVAGHAPSHVVVVREASGRGDGEVVAGIDGSRGSEAVLEFAFTEAGLRGTKLRAVRAWDLFGGAPDGRDLLADWRTRFPEVEAVVEHVQGHPADTLRSASKDAALLVVGTRGLGQISGMLLGSISHAMLHHADCPVAVIRQRKDEP